jgi:O-acetyl-ADP-ribose deacetylase (regulator of RNase III)
MPTAFTKGDIFETTGIQAYGFGGSTDGSMDVGIASAMKKRWPELAVAYAEHCQGGKFALGDVFVWTNGEVTVFALGIQNADGKPRLSALHTALRKMLQAAPAAKIKRIGLPRIGTGPVSLDWTRVRKLLGEITVGSTVRIDVFEQFIRTAKPATPDESAAAAATE